MSKKISALEAASQIVNLDEDSVPDWAVVVVGYLQPNGKEATTAWVSPDSFVRDVVWALEATKHNLLSAEAASAE